MEETAVAAAGSKRRRDGGEVADDVLDSSSPSPSPPDAKRIREDLFFDIIDDDSEPDTTDLVSVMRSLEEELGQAVAVSDSGPAACSDPGPTQPDLGFLLEASDDELGLPPPESAFGEIAGAVVDETGGVPDEGGFGKIWGLDDEIHLDFGFGPQDNGGDDGGVILDGGLFDYDGGFCGPADFSDLTWLPEYLPAV